MEVFNRNGIISTNKEFVMKTFIGILFIAMSVFSSEEAALKQIYDNRESLSVFFKNISFTINNEKNYQTFDGKDEFLSLTQKPFTEWQKNKDIIFKAFYLSCSYISHYSKNDSSFAINNDVYVKILIELLQVQYDKVIDRLINQTSFSLLKQNSNQIKAALESWPNDNDKKYRLLALCELSAKEKLIIDSAFGFSNVIRAKLGDTTQEDALINDFLSETNYRKKREKVATLCYIGSVKCIKALILNFNRPIFDVASIGVPKHPDIHDKCIQESIRFPICIGLRQLYPKDKLFNADIQKFDSFYDQLYGKQNDSADVKKFSDRFKEWAKVTYNVVPIDPDPMPIIKHYCTFMD